jgi:putative transposase
MQKFSRMKVMARLPRLNLPNIPQHVIQRGNNRHICFFTKQDYAVYLDKLRLYADKFQVSVHAFTLMTNHVHLLMTPSTEKGVSQLMQSLGRCYVMYINKIHKRSGTLWEGRYKSTLVDSEHYFLTVSRYIELNPVRANMVQHPADYPWTSYHHNALDKHIQLITPHSCYEALGKGPEERKRAYKDLFAQQIPELSLEEIRTSTNKAWVLGEDRFKQQIETATGRRVNPLPQGGDRKSEIFHQKRLQRL